MQTSFKNQDGPREQVITALEQLDHVLPGQGPILDFVHHNTIHGFQHLPFTEALAEYEALTGVSGYTPEPRKRQFYQQGRINDSDLSAALAQFPDLKAQETVCTLKQRKITRHDIYRVALLFDLLGISTSQLQWQKEELDALARVQSDVPEEIHKALFAGAGKHSDVISSLWQTILDRLELQEGALHPETLMELSSQQAQELLSASEAGIQGAESLQQRAAALLEELHGRIGDSVSLRGFVQGLTGVDILDSVRPQMIRLCASALDEGIAAWHITDNDNTSLYGAWRTAVANDANAVFLELSDWEQVVSELPDDAIDTIIAQLTWLEIPRQRWDGYLRRLALELPGWSGLINWRVHHPGYHTVNPTTPALQDYLAIRLVMDRLVLNQVCQDIWKIDARFSKFHDYFSRNLSELWVRHQWQQGDLPEYLMQLADDLIMQAVTERPGRLDWEQLAQLILAWQLGPMADKRAGHSVHDSGWRLFRLCQHLGLNQAEFQDLRAEDLLAMLGLLDEFNNVERSKVWLLAYELHYRDDLFAAVIANHRRGKWIESRQRPEAQIIMCMDEREESFRRHLEELNPAIETLGAAGFFSVPMNYKALDSKHLKSLCPIVVTPAHNVHERARKDQQEPLQLHQKGYEVFQNFIFLVHQRLRLNPLLSYLAVFLLAPVYLAGQVGHSLFPGSYKTIVDRLRGRVIRPVATELDFTSTDTETAATPEQPKLGFTDTEQATRVAGMLRTLGLTGNFSPIVAVAGHGSTSQNNPHEAAHDCGACSGRQGGPNARAFAAMVNRPQVRRLLAEQGIDIPQDCWFVGMQHDTCSDAITWYDLEQMPASLEDSFRHFRDCIARAQKFSAHERCRRFYSARVSDSPDLAMRHVTLRSRDLTQVRPEYGHATNASAVIGRRDLTQGLFLDRRVFLISYDPTQDSEGKIIENILLTAGPVGAGINLEYYFSTIDNDRFGCGTKIPHNVIGLFGVMEGAGSDLRTGLPEQMVEIHEAMRLQVLVEAKTSVLERIYGDQPALQELVGGGWLHLSAKDPDSDTIHVFEPGKGFVLWQGNAEDLPTSSNSMACYQNLDTPVAPVLITKPAMAGG